MKNFKNPIVMDKNEKKKKKEKRLRLSGLDGPNLLSLQKRPRLGGLGYPCVWAFFFLIFLKGWMIIRLLYKK
jgi:hypothetical protein